MQTVVDREDNIVAGDGHVRASDAARFLGVSRGLVYSLMDSGQLSYLRLGRARRIPKAALREFVERNLVSTC